MGERNTGVRVNVKPGDKSGLRDLENEGRKVGSSLRASIGGALSDGMKGGTEAVKSLLSNVKSAMGTIAGLMGGFGLKEVVAGALEANAKFGDLKWGIQAATGSSREYAAVQKQIQAASLATAQDSMKMVDVFEGIRGETGSLDFARGSIDDVAVAARGAHKPLEQMGAIAGTLNEKFGIEAGADLQGALADVVGLAEKGGVGFEDMAQKLGLIGAYAKEAGLEGREGFGQMVGLLNMADNANGNFKKGLTGVGTLLEQLGSSAGKNKIGAALGISGGALKGDAVSQIEAIMKATKGQKSQLEKAFGGETLKLLVDMGKTYGAAFDETKGSVKAKGDAAAAALRGALGDASKSAVKWSDIQTEAAAEMNEAPQKIATATEKLRQAFQSDKFQENLGKIIDKLPQLAELIAKIVNFAVDNPMGAGAAMIGGTFAKGAIESMITGAFSKGAAAAGPSIATAIAGSAGPWANVASLAGGPIGIAIAAGIGVALVAAMKEAKDEQVRRDAQAAAARKGFDAPRQKILGALEAQAGLEGIDDTGISDEVAGQMTSSQDQRDKLLEERLRAKAKRGAGDLAAGNALAMRYGWNLPQESLPGGGVDPSAAASGYGPYGGVSGRPNAPGTPAPVQPAAPAPAQPAAAPAWDPAVFAQMMATGVSSKELKVRVTNPNDIGGGGGPTGGVVLPPGWKPR
jgi:hypothetical protein